MKPNSVYPGGQGQYYDPNSAYQLETSSYPQGGYYPPVPQGYPVPVPYGYPAVYPNSYPGGAYPPAYPQQPPQVIVINQGNNQNTQQVQPQKQNCCQNGECLSCLQLVCLGCAEIVCCVCYFTIKFCGDD